MSSKGSYLLNCLKECGLIINKHPSEHIASEECVYIIRNLKRKVRSHFNYPENVNDLFACVENECDDSQSFKHFLFPNIVRAVDNSEDHPISESVLRILLHVPALQGKLANYIFNKAIDLAVECKCEPWIKSILKCFIGLDDINMNVLSTNLINLLEVSSEPLVRLEIITAIPDILADQEHENIASEMSRLINEEHDLIPAVLECLTYLCLSDDQYSELQNKTLNILMTLTEYGYYPSFVKFLLTPGRTDLSGYVNIIKGLRESVDWPTLSTSNMQDVANSQVLTTAAMRNSMISSKVISVAWMKVLSLCKISTDHKPLDIIILLLLYTISEEKQKVVEKFIRKQIKLDMLKEDLVRDSFLKFKPIFKKYLFKLFELTNSLLISQTDPLVENFASQIYILMYTELDDCQMIVSQLLQLALNRKQCITSILLILNKIGEKNMSMLESQSMHLHTSLMTLLDRMEDLNLNEKINIMNLICGLAYSCHSSTTRDDVDMIIRKQLGSSSPIVKIQGILTGVYAVKYLMRFKDASHVGDELSNRSIVNLPEGEIKEAAEIIELIARSTRQFPDLIVFYYDELCNVMMSASYINPYFIIWLTDAVTNDLERNFIVDANIKDKIGHLKISLQYCLNDEEDIDNVIAVNIAGLTLEPNDDVAIGILPSLFQLVQTLHSKQNNGDLSNINALLGCAIVMPNFDLDLIDDLELEIIHQILNCLFHCVNWFRELINGFATEGDEDLRIIILKRILQIEEMELLIAQILLKTSGPYKPPYCVFNIDKYNRDTTNKKPRVPIQKSNKKPADEETVLSEAFKSQSVQNNNFKLKGDITQNLHFRDLSLSLVHLFNNGLRTDTDSDAKLNIKVLKFLLKCVNDKLEKTLISKIKRKSFFTKPEAIVYDHEKAEACVKNINCIIPNLMIHMKYICEYLENHNDDMDCDTNSLEYNNYLLSLEYLYIFLATYLKWMGFKNHNNALLKASLSSIANVESNKVHLLKDLFVSVANFFKDHDKYCIQMSTAISLFDLLNTIHELSGNNSIHKILKNMSSKFLAKQWKTLDGVLEKGLYFNQSVEKITSLYFMYSDIIDLKQKTEVLREEVKHLKGRYDPLASFKCFNKGNFPILYRNIGTAIHDAANNNINNEMSNSDQLSMWIDIFIILNDMTEIAKIIDSRNNLSALFKKSLPILTLFITRGIPVVKVLFKSDTNDILTIITNLQKVTRFLQSLCCHSRLKKDTTLMAKVPIMKRTLENLIYKVKALLAAHNCSEAFWIGNLKNKNIHGELIMSQQSIDEQSTENADDPLPSDEDDVQDDINDEAVDPDKFSDII